MRLAGLRGRLNLILDPLKPEDFVLVDVDTDKYEIQNIAGKHPAEFASLLGETLDYRRQEMATPSLISEESSAEVLEDLRALGYLK